MKWLLWIYVALLVVSVVGLSEAFKTHAHCPGGGVSFRVFWATTECP